MEELIRQGLPGVEETVIENVIHHLQDLGMTYATDCQYVEEAYLKDLLKPIQIKKLLAFFYKYSSEASQPQIVCDVEFEERDKQIISKSPVSFLMSNISSQPSITPSYSQSPIPTSSTLNVLKKPEINWAENFIIPWYSFPKEVISVCEEKKRLTKAIYSQMVRILAEHISRVNPSPGRNNLRIISKQIVSQYPETFQDRCGNSIIDGCSTLMKKIEHCLENRKRRKDFSNLFDVEDKKNLKKTARNSYACSNWQPNQLPDGENKSTQIAHKDWLKMESKSLLRDEERIEEVMYITYASQRCIINNKSSVKIIKEEWPILFEEKYFLNHSKILLGSDSICDVIYNNLDVKSKIVLNFMKTKEKKDNISKWLKSIEIAQEQNSSDPEVLGCLLLLQAFFDEEEELFQFNMDPVCTADLERNAERLTPFIATSGGSVFSAEEFIIVIDGIVALRTKDSKLAVALLILAFFVFNIEYPQKAACTLEFVQRIFADINPDRGSKTPKNKNGKRTPVAKPVMKLVNDLRDFETHFNL